MSLFTDLREVFTAYAQRIKGLATADEQIRADLEAIEPGLSEEGKAALLNCFTHAAWTADSSGHIYVNALLHALYPDMYPRIVVEYTPGTHVVYVTDSLDSLKSYLVVKYYETSESSGTVISSANYTLTGELAVGTSIITVNYNNLTISFRVEVESQDPHLLYYLPANTVFDGTSATDVLTDLLLISSRRTFSFVLSGTIEIGSSDSGLKRILMIRNSSNSIEMIVDLDVTNKFFEVAYGGNAVKYTSGSAFSIGTHTFKVAFSHAKDDTSFKAEISFDGHAANSGVYNFNYTGGNYPLFIGGTYSYSNGSYNIYQRFVGTIKEFTIHDYAMDATTIHDYVTAQ